MAALIGRASRQALLRVPGKVSQQQVNQFSFKALPKSQKILAGVAGAVTAGVIGVGAALNTAVLAELHLHPPQYPWSHNGILSSLDHASVRRGYMVYKQVCAACHSMDYMYYRYLVGTIMDETEAKAEAAEVMVKDGPDEEGKLFDRPGKLSDRFPRPYANEEEGKAANNGALPPDLSFICYARHGGEDYLFSLLTGYCDAPAGVEVADGQYYNPYFAGGKISMAQALYNEIIEYDDGTPATSSQMAKDVSTFLAWTADIHHDDRKRMGLKTMMVMLTLTLWFYYMKRHKWTVLKSYKILAKPKSK